MNNVKKLRGGQVIISNAEHCAYRVEKFFKDTE